MKKIFQTIVIAVSLFVVQSVFAEAEKSKDATVSTKEWTKDNYKPQAAKKWAVPAPAPAPAPAGSVWKDSIEKQGDREKQGNEAGH